MSEIIRPEPASVEKGGDSSMSPEDYMADMANAKMAKDFIAMLGRPSIVSKQFIVWQGIWSALNHTDTNKTYLDTSLRLAIYDHVAKNSVNVDGKYFERAWQYLMKPRFVISQNIGATPNSFDQDQPGFIGRLWQRLRGQQPQQQPNNGQ